MQAAEEKNDNYEKALGLHKKAQWFNIAGFVFLVISGIVGLTVLIIAVVVGTALATAASASSNTG